jgi:SAM-dependent methyltransferase
MDATLAAVAAAYEGLEAPESFPDRAALERYRDALLAVSLPQADLLAAAGPRVLEIGCGNGRLLIELARRGVVTEALGVDVSASRIAFAAEWGREEGFDQLEFRAEDALALELEPGSFDAAVCITGALGYFGAASPRLDGDLVALMRRAVRPGGLIVLELDPHPRERGLLEAAGGEINLWKELGADDPWRFYLSAMKLDQGVLRHEKTFVHRHDGRIDEGRVESL